MGCLFFASLTLKKLTSCTPPPRFLAQASEDRNQVGTGFRSLILGFLPIDLRRAPRIRAGRVSRRPAPSGRWARKSLLPPDHLTPGSAVPSGPWGQITFLGKLFPFWRLGSTDSGPRSWPGGNVQPFPGARRPAGGVWSGAGWAAPGLDSQHRGGPRWLQVRPGLSGGLGGCKPRLRRRVRIHQLSQTSLSGGGGAPEGGRHDAFSCPLRSGRARPAPRSPLTLPSRSSRSLAARGGSRGPRAGCAVPAVPGSNFSGSARALIASRGRLSSVT